MNVAFVLLTFQLHSGDMCFFLCDIDFATAIGIDFCFSLCNLSKGSFFLPLYHTAVPIAKAFGLEIIKTEQLREVFAGEWQGQSFDVLESKYAKSYWTWRNDIGNAYTDGGESVAEVSQRVWDEVNRIVQKEAGKTVVIATHATPIRALLCCVAGWELAKMKDIGWVSNASVSIVRVEDGKWSLEQKSFDAHLAELKTHFPANV